MATLRGAVIADAQRARSWPPRQPAPSHHLLALQQAAGNRAVAAYLQRSAGNPKVAAPVQRICCTEGHGGGDASSTLDDSDAAIQRTTAPPSVQRDGEADGRLSSLRRELAALRGSFSAGPIAALSAADAQALEGKLAELSRTRGFERVRPLGLHAGANASAAALVEPMPVPLSWPAILELLEAIGAGIAAASLWEILLVIALILAILLLLRKAFQDPAPVPVTTPSPTTTPEQDPRKDPNKQGGPGPTVDPLPPSPCSPTGLTPRDPIPITWFKPVVDDYYPRRLHIQGHDYDRDSVGHLPHGEPIGVSPAFWPSVGKIMQLIPATRGPGADDFRDVLLGYGFNWTGLQADHVQDLEWEGADSFENLWPMDSGANLSAGARNNQQLIGVCITPIGSFVMYTLQQLKAAGLYGRYFQIRNLSR